MISVAQALDHLFSLVDPLPVETVPLLSAAGRVLAEPVTATRDQPPFPASAMDGYAVTSRSVGAGKRFTVIGESAAGRRFDGAIGAGEAVRIFTGAPLPKGADHVVIQEDVTRVGDQITLNAGLDSAPYVRPAGTDFTIGQQITAPRLLSPSDIALLASMNIAQVPVHRRADVALISTGDELVMPGETPGPDQIIASNTLGLHALLTSLGATPRLLPIARDNRDSLSHILSLASEADLIVTIGGASEGDHDLVGAVAAEMGLDQKFYKVAMRPGKPLMAGRLGTSAMVGLPGNPVSAMVCGHVFLAPMVRALHGLPKTAAPMIAATLAADLPANGPRAHYMRARLDGTTVTAFPRQDSALLSVLSSANALLLRPPHDPSLPAGTDVSVLPL